MDEIDWKSRLYASYISTGMSRASENISIDYFNQYKYTAKRIKKYLGDKKNTKIVDLGCGAGGLLYQIEQMGYINLSGVDYSIEQIETANKLGLKYVIQGTISGYLEESINNSIDTCILMDVIEHFRREELIELLTLLRVKMKSDGIVIIHIPNAEGIFGNRIRFGDLTHELAFTRQSLEQIFKATGFHSTKCIEDKPFIHGITSLIRRIIWEIGTIPFRLLFAAETGSFDPILSQNMLCVIKVSK